MQIQLTGPSKNETIGKSQNSDETLEQQLARVQEKLVQFFAFAVTVIAIDLDEAIIFTNAKLDSRHETERGKAIELNEFSLTIRTKDKTFIWDFVEGVITIGFEDNLVSISIMQKKNESESIVQFIRC